MTILEFIAKWRQVELKERSAAPEHFLDLCHVFDHPTPAAYGWPANLPDAAILDRLLALHRATNGGGPSASQKGAK